MHRRIDVAVGVPMRQQNVLFLLRTSLASFAVDDKMSHTPSADTSFALTHFSHSMFIFIIHGAWKISRWSSCQLPKEFHKASFCSASRMFFSSEFRLLRLHKSIGLQTNHWECVDSETKARPVSFRRQTSHKCCNSIRFGVGMLYICLFIQFSHSMPALCKTTTIRSSLRIHK